MAAGAFQASPLSQLAPILADIGVAAPVALTDIKDGSGRVYRVDLADGGAVVLKVYDRHYNDHYLVSGERYAQRLLDKLDLPISRYLDQDETCTRLPFPFAITNFLPGQTVKTLSREPDIADLYRQMGTLLRKLHSVRVPAFGKFGRDGVVNPMRSNAEYMREAVAHAFSQFRTYGGGEALAIQLEAIVADCFEAMTWSRGPVFAHDDLNPNNVLALRDASGRLRLTGLIDFGNARASDAVSDLAKTLFNSEHDARGSSPFIREAYGPVDHPDPEGALWFYTLHHRVVMWWWLRHVGVIADGRPHPLLGDLQAMADFGPPR